MIGEVKQQEHYYFMKPCIKCDEMFRPTGRATQICDDCKKKEKEERRNKK